MDDKGAARKRLIACGVQDIPASAKEAENFGFAVEDIGDYLYDTLRFYGLDLEAVEFVTGDNAYVNKSLCAKIEEWLLREKQIDRAVPLVGCASHRLNLAVQLMYSKQVFPLSSLFICFV